MRQLLLGALLVSLSCARPTGEPFEDDDDATPSKGGSKASGGSDGKGGGGGGGAKSLGGGGSAGKGGSGGKSSTPEGGAPSEGGEPPTNAGGEPGVVDPGPSTPPGVLTMHYKAGNAAATDNQIGPHFRIVSSGDAPVLLSALSARYYFTSEPPPPLTIEIYNTAAEGTSGYRALPSGSVLATPQEGYVELTFTEAAGLLDAGGHVTIEIAIHDAGWSGLFDETNDYSFNAAHGSFAAWDQITLYDGGTLVSGIEPP